MQNHIFAGIIIKLLTKKTVQIKDLAEEYGVSVRTIHRYINELSTELPVYTKRGNGGGLSLMDNFCIDRLYFSPEELSRICFSVQNDRINFKDKTHKSLEEKLNALQNSNKSAFELTSDSLYIDSLGWNSDSVRGNSMTPLSNAISKRKKANIDYIDQYGKLTNRDVEPHTLVYKENIWYIYAYCLSRLEFRLFRLSRIQSVRLSDESFERREIDLASALTIKNVPEIRLKLQFEKPLLQDIEEWLGFKNISVENGKYLIEAVTFGGAPLVRKLLSLGNSVKVLEPADLALELKNTLSEIINNYY